MGLLIRGAPNEMPASTLAVRTQCLTMGVLLHAHWRLVESVEILIQAIRICTGKVTCGLVVVSRVLRPEDVTACGGR